MEYLNQIYFFILGHDFLVSFWSGIAVSTVIGLIVYQYTGVFKSPKLYFAVKQDGFYRDTILLTEDGEYYKARFQFAIKNTGNKAIKNNEGYWHLYLDVKNPTIFSAPEEIGHSRGGIAGTVYPGSFLDIDLIYELEMKKENLEKSEVPYFFSTDYGQYPKGAVVDQRTGAVLIKNMAHIKYELPDK